MLFNMAYKIKLNNHTEHVVYRIIVVGFYYILLQGATLLSINQHEIIIIISMKRNEKSLKDSKIEKLLDMHD